MKTFTIENDTNNIIVFASGAEAEAILDSEHFATEAELAGLATNWPAARLVEIYNSLPGVTEVRKFKDRATAVSRIWKAIQTLGEALPQVGCAEQPESESLAEAPPDSTLKVPAEAEFVPAEGAPLEPERVASPEADLAPTVPPQTPDVAPEAAPATNDATPATAAPVSAPDEKLLRSLARAFEGLTPEQCEMKWDALKIALAARESQIAAAPRQVTRSEGSREGSKTSAVIAMLKREGGVTLEEIMQTMAWQKHTTRAMLSAGGSLVKKHGLVIVSEKVGENRVYSIKA